MARAISNDPEGLFTARAVTRNPESDKAKALAQGGAEVVSADLDHLESLEAAMKGAWGAFCVTNYWEHFSPEKEIAQAANLAKAASTAGVEHVIWSTLEDSRELVPLDDRSERKSATTRSLPTSTIAEHQIGVSCHNEIRCESPAPSFRTVLVLLTTPTAPAREAR